MKIVMFTDAYWPRVNGVTVSVDSFSRALVKAGHQVVIICALYPESQTLECMSNPVMDVRENDSEPITIRIPSYQMPISKEDRVAKFHKWFWVSKQLNAFAPDLVHVNTEFIIGEFGFYYAKTHVIPVVYTFHTLWEDYAVNYVPHVPEFILRFIARRMIKHMANRAQTIIAPSPQIRDVLKRYKVKKYAHFLPTGIDPVIFQNDQDSISQFRETIENKYPNIKNKRILLFAGRIGREKNVSFLLQMMPAILEHHSDVILVLVGNGPDLEAFREEAEALGIGKKCVFTGYLDRKDLSLVYAMSTLFVFPSLTETQGLVTIEAMLSGIPVVAIGVMGTLTVMGGDNGGFMVKNDPAEFNSRVLDLLSDSELYAKKVAEAHLHALSWTIDTMSVKLEQVYEDTLMQFHGSKKNKYP